MPPVASLEALHRAIAEFRVADFDLVIEPIAQAAARRSLSQSGLLLAGEMHGVRENALVIGALMDALELSCLALEWPAELAPDIGAFLSAGSLADHELLWLGDGRITAGHLAVLRDRAAAGPLDLTLIDQIMTADASWSQRDAAMARSVLAAASGPGLLVVAGNAHTPVTSTDLGIPLGACLAAQRPGVREVRIRYGSGTFYNGGPRQFRPTRPPGRLVRLHQQDSQLVLDVPIAHEALVPHRPMTWLRPGHQHGPL